MDCLIKSYRSEVNNNELLKIGEMLLPVVNGSLYIVTDKTITLTPKGCLLNGNSSSITVQGSSSSTIAITGVGSGVIANILVSNKYTLRRVEGPVVFTNDVDAFSGCDILYDFKMTNFTDSEQMKSANISFEAIAKNLPVLTDLTIGGTISGDIASLLPLKNVLQNVSINISVKKYGGNFANLGHMNAFTDASLSSVFNGGTSGISGTVEGFVAAKLEEHPATAGSVSIRWLGYGDKVTYQGQPITPKADNTIAWDAQGNITLT